MSVLAGVLALALVFGLLTGFMPMKADAATSAELKVQLDALKELDTKVKRPANVFAYVFGSVSAIIMGSGMSLVMTDIGEMLGMAETMIPGVVIGVIGLALAIINYPIYKNVLASRRKKYADKIIALSDELMKG